MGQLSGLPLAELTAQTPTRFFIRGVDAQVTFEDTPGGAYKALLLRMNGGEARAIRVD